MKTTLLSTLAFVLLFGSIGCTTLANRRDLYNPQTVEGPYTKMLKKGIPKPNATPSPMQGSDFKNAL